jgi:hypothetical protein
VKVLDPNAPTLEEANKILYTVRVRGSMPGDPDPGRHTPDFATSLPGIAAPRFNPRGLTFLTVQIALTSGKRKRAPRCRTVFLDRQMMRERIGSLEV